MGFVCNEPSLPRRGALDLSAGVVIHEEEQGGCDDEENDKAAAGRRHFVVQWKGDGRNERYKCCFKYILESADVRRI